MQIHLSKTDFRALLLVFCLPEIFHVVCSHGWIWDPIIYNGINRHRYWVPGQNLVIQIESRVKVTYKIILKVNIFYKYYFENL